MPFFGFLKAAQSGQEKRTQETFFSATLLFRELNLWSFSCLDIKRAICTSGKPGGKYEAVSHYFIISTEGNDTASMTHWFKGDQSRKEEGEWTWEVYNVCLWCRNAPVHRFVACASQLEEEGDLEVLATFCSTLPCLSISHLGKLGFPWLLSLSMGTSMAIST